MNHARISRISSSRQCAVRYAQGPLSPTPTLILSLETAARGDRWPGKSLVTEHHAEYEQSMNDVFTE